MCFEISTLCRVSRLKNNGLVLYFIGINDKFWHQGKRPYRMVQPIPQSSSSAVFEESPSQQTAKVDKIIE